MLRPTLGLAVFLGAVSIRAAELSAGAETATNADAASADEGACEAEEYAESGVLELGGRIGILWNEDRFTLEISPSVGYFVSESLELSAFLVVSYENERDDETGERETSETYSFVLEPSYHAPLREDVYLFGGLGIGVGHDGDNFDFEIIPRVGINTSVTLQGVLSPAVRAPIVIDADETTVGIGFDVAYTVAW